MKRSNLVILALFVCTFLFVGFPGRESWAAAEAKPRYGGILKMHGYEPYSLGYPPTMTAQTDGQQASVCIEALFRFDEKGNTIPLLATGWKADVKSKTITLALRKGVKFHDGSNFDAKLCKWNIDKFREGKRTELSHVDSVDVIDDYTVRLNLSVFDNVVISHLAHDAGRMISQAAYDKNGQAWCEKNPVGTGPFQFVSWQKDVGIKWKRFDGYWDGKPYLDGVEMLRSTDPVADLMMFKSGEKHMTVLEPKDAATLEKEGNFNIVVPPEGQVASLGGNSKDPKSPFADIRVRQAISYAIDTKALSNAFGYGYYKATNQWAGPTSWAYDPGVKGYPYNPSKAKQLLAAAGYANGFKTAMHFYNLSPVIMDEMTVVQRQLKDVGIDAALDGVQRPRFAEMASLGKGWDGMIRMQAFSRPDALAQIMGFASKGANEFSEVVRPPEILELYDKASSAPDMATKRKLTHELMAMWTDKYCLSTFLTFEPNPIGKSKKLHDDLFGVVPNRYLSPKAWLSE
jgi:peptide/nickel transport system substrate-binding protein